MGSPFDQGEQRRAAWQPGSSECGAHKGRRALLSGEDPGPAYAGLRVTFSGRLNVEAVTLHLGKNGYGDQWQSPNFGRSARLEEVVEQAAATPILEIWVLPIAIAVIGLLGGIIGARIGASSSLRLRLVDIVQSDNDAHHKFHVGAIAAVNELGLATHHMLNRRIGYLRSLTSSVRLDKAQQQVKLNPLEISPNEDLRVASATEAWRAVLAEAHVFAKARCISAFEKYDQQRHTVISLTDGSWSKPELTDVVEQLEAAMAACETLRGHFGRQIYRELQIEKATGTLAVFDLARRWRLRRVAKQIVKATEKQIASGLELVENANTELSESVQSQSEI